MQRVSAKAMISAVGGLPRSTDTSPKNSPRLNRARSSPSTLDATGAVEHEIQAGSGQPLTENTCSVGEPGFVELADHCLQLGTAEIGE